MCVHVASFFFDPYLPSQAVEAINRKDLLEMSYGKPPPPVEQVLEACLVLLGLEPTLSEAKKQLQCR